jgi:hypothetical protein
MTRTSLLLAQLGVLVAPIEAQSPEPTPATIVAAFFGAIARGDGHAAVAYVIPEDVPEFRRRELAIITEFYDRRDEFRAMLQAPRPSGNAAVGLSPMPPFDSAAVAKYATMPLAVYGVRTVGEFAALPPNELLARALSQSGEDQSPRRIIGFVMEQDTMAYVLFRRDNRWVGGDPQWMVELAHAVRRNGRWYVRLAYGFGGGHVTAALFKTLEAPLNDARLRQN